MDVNCNIQILAVESSLTCEHQEMDNDQISVSPNADPNRVDFYYEKDSKKILLTLDLAELTKVVNICQVVASE